MSAWLKAKCFRYHREFKVWWISNLLSFMWIDERESHVPLPMRPPVSCLTGVPLRLFWLPFLSSWIYLFWQKFAEHQLCTRHSRRGGYQDDYNIFQVQGAHSLVGKVQKWAHSHIHTKEGPLQEYLHLSLQEWASFSLNLQLKPAHLFTGEAIAMSCLLTKPSRIPCFLCLASSIPESPSCSILWNSLPFLLFSILLLFS